MLSQLMHKPKPVPGSPNKSVLHLSGEGATLLHNFRGTIHILFLENPDVVGHACPLLTWTESASMLGISPFLKSWPDIYLYYKGNPPFSQSDLWPSQLAMGIPLP